MSCAVVIRREDLDEFGVDNPLASGPFDRVVIHVVKDDLLSRFGGVCLDDDAGVLAGVAGRCFPRRNPRGCCYGGDGLSVLRLLELLA